MTEFAQAMVDGFALGSLYSLLALSVALVFGLLGLANFAHGELLMIGGYTLYLLDGVALPIVLVALIVVVVISAVLMERFAFRPLRDADPTTLMISSFAVAYLLQSVALYIFGARPKSVDVASFANGSVEFLGLYLGALDLVNIGAAIVLLGGLAAFLRRSPIGIQMRASAEDFRTARLLGVRAHRVISIAFAISGLFAAVTAFLLVAQGGTVTPSMGLAPVLVAFVATIIGGMGRLGGSAMGGFLLGIGTVLLQVYLPDGLVPFRDAFVYAAVIAVLLVRPQGLFGSKALVSRV